MKGWKKVLSLTLAAAMLLSMVLVSGITASADAKNALVYRINSSNLHTDGIYTPVDIVDHTDDKGFTITRATGGSNDSVGAYFVIDGSILSAMPYLVIEPDPDRSSGLAVAFYGWGTTGNYSTGNLTGASQKIMVNLRELCPDYTCQLWCYGTTGQSFAVKSCYLTSVNPGIPEKETGIELIATWANNPYININRAVFGTSGHGMTAYGPWTGTEGFGYIYSLIPAAQIAKTPYLALKVAADGSLGNIGGIFGAFKDDIWTELQTFTPTTDLQIIDLNALNGGNAVMLRITFAADVNFTLLYLAADQASIVDEADPPAAPLALVDKAGYNSTLDTLIRTKVGDYGATFEAPAEGDAIVYWAFTQAEINARPYLIYKAAALATAGVFGVYGPTWWENGTNLPWNDTDAHVVDLRTTTAYAQGGEVLIQFGFPNGASFDYLVLSADDAFDPAAAGSGSAEPEATYYDVNFVTNGGSMVYSQLVQEGGKVDPVTTTRESYTATWYTDPECTTPYDFNAAVTSDLTLYAGWKVTQGTSRVYAQVKVGTTSTTAKTDIRFVAAIDSLNFDEVGFVLVSYAEDYPDYPDMNTTLVVDGTECDTWRTDTVWESINAAGSAVTAQALDGNYIIGLTVTNIPSKKGGFNISIGIKAFAKRGDLVYYSNAASYCVNDFLE
ncbi:MAG: InlB B-repeat-containing protein [Clostridia bacterium]|nr:InlB B-repeat-containing protein [Clostridia bacterium]